MLAVGAHPDDVEIGIGGILLRHAAQGHHVTVLTLTGGEAGGVAAERAAEAARAAELLSARLIHAALADTSVSEGGVDDRHDPRGHRGDPADHGLHAHDPRRPPGPPQRAQRDARRRPRDLARLLLPGAVDHGRVQADALRRRSTSSWRRKIEVIQAYTSQVKIRDYLDEELLRATARYWSRFATARYVEPLEVVRDSDEAGRRHRRPAARRVRAPAAGARCRLTSRASW